MGDIVSGVLADLYLEAATRLALNLENLIDDPQPQDANAQASGQSNGEASGQASRQAKGRQSG